MKPPKLNSGDLVAIVSPSNTIAHRSAQMDMARRNFEQATGLKTVLSPNALAKHYYSAGTITQRLNDFDWAVNNPEVKAIIFSVGGNTAIELVDGLDYSLLTRNPKPISGISDATTLLNAITAKTGLITFLGIEFLDYASEPMKYETSMIKQTWLEGDIGSISPNTGWRDFDDLPTTYRGWRSIRKGVAVGTLVGGNGSGFIQLYGTEYLPSFSGSILVIEGYQKSKKAIHQQLTQLKIRGAFDEVNGLIVGYFVGSDDVAQTGNNRDLAELVLEATAGYDFPIMQIGEIGHNVENILLPIGARAELDANAKKLTILENVVLS